MRSSAGRASRGGRWVALATAAVLSLAMTACGDSDAPLQDAASQLAPAAAQPAPKATGELIVTPLHARVPFGAPTAVRVVLTAGGAAAAGETVEIRVGGSTRTVRTDAGGGGTVKLADLAPGKQRVIARFAGDAATLPASASTSVMVEPAAVRLALELTPQPTGATTASAAMTVKTGVPAAGTVTFAVDGAALPAVTVADGAAAAEIAPTLNVGEHTVTAVFAPDEPKQLTAAKASSVLSVTKVPVTVAAAGSKETIRYGDWASFEVTVASTVPGVDLAGPVTVADAAGTVVAEGATDAGGHASLGFLNRANPGSAAYSVSFAGSESVDAAAGEVVIQTTQTNVDLAIDHPATVKPGDTTTISLSVIGTPDKPTGAATISVDGAQIAAGELADGTLGGTTGALAAGDHTVTVTYGGDARFEANEASTTLSVVEPPVNPNAGGAAALQASNPCPASADACIDLSSDQAWLQSGGTITYGPVPITSGMSGYRTPAGTFSVFYKDRDHRSSLFNDAPMPNSVFFNGGIAFHAGSLYDQSHGCIHLSWDASEAFYAALPIGATVVAWGAAPY